MATEQFTDTELDGLSEEERAAITEEGEATEQSAEGEAAAADGAQAETNNDAPADDKPATDAAVTNLPADDTGAVDNDGTTEKQDDPVFVPQFDAGKVRSNQEYDAAQQDLLKKYEEGEITLTEYTQQNNALLSESLRAQMYSEMNESMARQRWTWEQNAYFEENPAFGLNDKGQPADPVLYAALDAQLKALYADRSFSARSGLGYLREAGKRVLERFQAPAKKQDEPKKPADKKPALQSAEIPQTLSHVPAASENNAGSEFAELDKLGGLELEVALSQMSDDKQRRYLALR